MRRFIGSLVALLGASAVFAGCSDDDDDDGGGGQSAISFSGTILGQPTILRGNPTVVGLEGVVIEVLSTTSSDSKQATTDGDGNFIVLQPPTGAVHLHIDGSGVSGGTFANLQLALVIGGGASNLSQPIVLPNLDDGQTLVVAVDGNGVTAGDQAVGDPLLDGFSLEIPDMTTILIEGLPPTGPVSVNVTPVDAINVPMPLPGTLNPGAFVSIQPPDASFSPALSITLPNTDNFPLGTLVDLWSFDHGDGAWVNRSEQTGHQGTVVDIGGSSFIFADGVITEGGWHAGAIPVVASCATTIEGQVFELGSTTPLVDVLISLSTGQFARTGSDGRFSIPSVPAYDAALLPKVCSAIDLELRAIAPVAFGSNVVTMTISAGTIATGETTTLDPFDIPVDQTGSLVGSAIENGAGVQGTLSITGTSKASVDTDAFGSFFVSALEPGPYTATFPFESGDISADFTINAHETTVVQLSPTPVSGGELNVLVLDFLASDSGTPVASACVTLQGAGGAPLFATAGGNGVALFNNAPAGPYVITAQKDTTTTFGIERNASTVVGVTATGNPPTIVIPFLNTTAGAGGIVTDASLEGTILNEPAGVLLEYTITSASGFFGNGAAGGGFTNPIPSGELLDAVVVARDLLTDDVVSTVLVTGLTAATAQALMVNFDFNDACPFDQTVALSYTNQQTANDFTADLELRGNGELALAFTDGSALPTSVNWPDLTRAKLAGLDLFFDVGTVNSSTIFSESFCEVGLGHTTPSTLQINFLGTPTIQSPVHNSNLISFGPGDTVDFTLGSGNGTSAGFNSVTFFGEITDVFVFWDFFLAPEASSLTIPPVFASKPMFAPGFFVVTAGAVRFDFPGFDFATFFDQNLASNIAAVTAGTTCQADTSHFFNVLGPGARTGSGAPQRDLAMTKRRLFR